MKTQIDFQFTPEHNKSIKVVNGNKTLDFYEIKSAITAVEDIDELRLVCELGFTAYNRIMKPIIQLPTTKTNPERKVFDAFFSLLNTDLAELFKRLRKDFADTKCSDTLLNWTAYLLSIMPKYDLAPSVVILGAKRSSKSVLCGQYIRRKYAFNNTLRSLDDADKILVNEQFAKKKVVYTDITQFKEILKNNKEGDVVFDDAILVGDKRRSMSAVNMVISQYINFYASQRNTTWSLIQHRDYLDTRFITDSNMVVMVINRGYGLLFAMPRAFACIIKDLYGFEDLIKEPKRFFSNTVKGLDALMRLPSYIGELYYDDLKDNIFWDSISEVKTTEQQKSEKDVNSIEQEIGLKPEISDERVENLLKQLEKNSKKDYNIIPNINVG